MECSEAKVREKSVSNGDTVYGDHKFLCFVTLPSGVFSFLMLHYFQVLDLLEKFDF